MTSATSSLIALGEFGFVSLLDSARVAVEFECLVLETGEGNTAVIGTPGSALVTDSGEWVEVTAEAIEGLRPRDFSPSLTVEGWTLPIVLKRVTHQAIASSPLGQTQLRAFTREDLIAARPPIRAVRAAYCGQDVAVSASETDVGASLRTEN